MIGGVKILLEVVLVLLVCLLLLCLLRAVKGPRVADRIVAVNMMGTMVMVMIAILAVMLGEGYLVDICLIYAMVSFLAVIVLTKVYMGVYRQKKEETGKVGLAQAEAGFGETAAAQKTEVSGKTGLAQTMGTAGDVVLAQAAGGAGVFASAKSAKASGQSE